MADMFDGGVSSVLSSFDATASQPAQNGAGTGVVKWNDFPTQSGDTSGLVLIRIGSS